MMTLHVSSGMDIEAEGNVGEAASAVVGQSECTRAS